MERSNAKAVFLDLSTLLSGEETQRHFAVELTPDIDDPDIRLSQAVRFTGVVKECGGFVRITATLETTFESLCARCLAPVQQSLQVPFEADGFEPDKLPVDDQDGEWVLIEDSKLDLFPIVYETLAVHLPTRMLCREDCRGLCPVCGTDLNLSTCACNTKTVDPRLEGLMDFFK